MCYRDRAAGLGIFLFLLASILSLPASLDAQPDAAPVLNGGEPQQIATAGYYTLIWSSPTGPNAADAPTFELVESTNERFTDQTVRYRGPDLATTISGKPDGIYYYRVRRADEASGGQSPWSNVHRVVVEHHSLRRAVTFMIVGGLVFAATFVVVVWGYHREPRESPPFT